jgi:DnaJ-class molecular chaperone
MKKKVLWGSAIALVAILLVGGIVGTRSLSVNPIKNALADIVITRTCPTCHGSGKMYIKKKCYSCPDGVEKVEVTCSTCNGTGKITERK